MPRANLRKTAASQARAEFNPQIQSTRRGIRGQVRSIQSSGPALEASLQRTSQQLRHAGLSPRDQAIALRELALRTADVGASTALQTQQVRQEGHGEIVDLQKGRALAESATLAELQQAAAQHAQEVQDAENADARGIKMEILKEEALKGLGLGSYADDGEGGLSDTQRGEIKDSRNNAGFFAKQYFTAAKDGITDEKGEVLIPPDPKSWDDAIWDGFVSKVAAMKGVDSVEDAQRAVSAIRDHVNPSASPSEALGALGTVASAAAPALAPAPLAPIAQFGSALLRQRR